MPTGQYGETTGPWVQGAIYDFGVKVTFYGENWMSQVASNVALQPGKTYTSGGVTWPTAWLPVGPNTTYAQSCDWNYSKTYHSGDLVQFHGGIWMLAPSVSTSQIPDTGSPAIWQPVTLPGWSGSSSYSRGDWVSHSSLAYIAIEHSVPADVATPGVSSYWFNPLDDNGNPVYG